MAKRMQVPDNLGQVQSKRTPTPFARVETPSSNEVTARKNARLRRLPASTLLAHPLQPPDRHSDINVVDLMASIAALGLRQPPLIWLQSDGRYTILAGHRRVRACQLLAQEGSHDGRVDVYVLSDITDREALYLIGAETFHRQDFSAVHEAVIIGAVREAKVLEIGRAPTIRELADVIPPGRTSIGDAITIYDALGHPQLGPLVRQADKAGKMLLSRILRAPELRTQIHALEEYLRDGESAAKNVLGGSKRGRPPSSITHKTRRDGYDLTVRVRPTMSVEDARKALTGLTSAARDLEQIIIESQKNDVAG